MAVDDDGGCGRSLCVSFQKVPISEEDLKKEMEELKEELQCAVCLDILKKPVMILPCLHSFCSPCIQAVSETSSSSSSSSSPSPCKCPVCRQEFSTSGGGKGGVQENPFLDSQVDRLEEVRKTLEKITGISLDIELCDVCDPTNKRDASVRCLDCKKNLCEEHEEQHKNFLPDHKVLDMCEASDLVIISSSSPPQHPPCPHYPSEKKNLMCLKCEAPICSFCVFKGDHKGHEALPAEDVIDQKKEKLSGLVDSVQDRHKDLDKSLSLIDQMETKIQESLISQKANILKEMEDLRKKIDQRQEELLNELETKSKEKLDRLAQQRKKLEADLSCLENSVKVSRSFLKNASDDQLSSHFHLLSDQLTRLKEDKTFTQIPWESRICEVFVRRKLDLGDLLKDVVLTEIRPRDILPESLGHNPIDFSRLAFSFSFGVKGTGDGQFDIPRRCAVDKDNRIIVCDHVNNRIQV